MHRRIFIQHTALLATGALAGFRGAPVIGHGDFRYRIDSRWCRADPAVHPVKNCHEMVFDKQGRIFMTTDDLRNNILVFDKDGRVLEAWGTEYPGAHGLTYHDENGAEMLYIADYERHQVIKTTLGGEVVRTFEWPADSGKYQDAAEFRPTETAVAPNGDVYVSDGYGKDFIIHYDHDGKVKNVFGGGAVLQNAHGIALDTRLAGSPALLVSSRAENALKRFSLAGELLETIALPGAYICRPVVQGPNVYFAVLISQLPWDSGSGFVCILNEKNRVVSAPCASAPRYNTDGTLRPLYQTVRAFRHPHDVLPDSDGNLYVAQWNSGGAYPYRMERVK
ncbi:MAG: 6-bladed beta-propeller [Saprospirales bacterium]|nr:6-bladed beta-propeller [Saprospirales bacterium]MBK8923069.1 6-bladed beta-propeller [Saprospirales bacterium]